MQADWASVWEATAGMQHDDGEYAMIAGPKQPQVRLGWVMGAMICAGLMTAACDTPQGSAEHTKQVERDEPSEATPEPPEQAAPVGAPRLRTVYVPAYSYLTQGSEIGQKTLLSVILSVRNVDSTATVTLTHVDYFDTSGHRVRRYLKSPRQLRPLETAEFTVEKYDEAGGSGANFLVYWEGPTDAHALLVETVMFAHVGNGHVAFTSRGVELDMRPPVTVFTPSEPSEAAGASGSP